MAKRVIDSPFPYFGGKSRVARQTWQAFGDIQNYTEPFFGSGAVLLARPASDMRKETVNDKDGFVANFWRAIAKDAALVAKHADWPKLENDLHARHAYLHKIRHRFAARLEGDPEYCSFKIAGWWVWCMCSAIATTMSNHGGPWESVNGRLVKTASGTSSGNGINRSLINMTDQGIFRKSSDIYEWFEFLEARLKHVRVACGDWSRIMGPSVTYFNGLTGVFLDPPYGEESGKYREVYINNDLSLASQVEQWCVENGANKELRIVLCGYEGAHNRLEPLGWTKVPWKATGGYGNQGKEGNDTVGKKNSFRERMWLSPHCQQSGSGLLSHVEYDDTDKAVREPIRRTK